jgi:hypothetical protein
MTIIRREIEVDVLAQARLFFENSPREESMRMVAAIHEEQPYFLAVAQAWRQFDVPDHVVKELLQSIMDVYYAVTVLLEQRVRTIEISDISIGVDQLREICKSLKSNVRMESIRGNPATAAYFENAAVFEHAVDVIFRAFGDTESVLDVAECIYRYTESLAIYFALLRAIEVAE